jgi:hypothetical protein
MCYKAVDCQRGERRSIAVLASASANLDSRRHGSSASPCYPLRLGRLRLACAAHWFPIRVSSQTRPQFPCCLPPSLQQLLQATLLHNPICLTHAARLSIIVVSPCKFSLGAASFFCQTKRWTARSGPLASLSRRQCRAATSRHLVRCNELVMRAHLLARRPPPATLFAWCCTRSTLRAMQKHSH